MSSSTSNQGVRSSTSNDNKDEKTNSTQPQVSNNKSLLNLCQTIEVQLHNIGKSLSCAICHSTPNADSKNNNPPVLLSECMHLYCQSCLQRALKYQLKCPACQIATTKRSILQAPNQVYQTSITAYKQLLQDFGLAPITYAPHLYMTQLPSVVASAGTNASDETGTTTPSYGNLYRKYQASTVFANVKRDLGGGTNVAIQEQDEIVTINRSAVHRVAAELGEDDDYDEEEAMFGNDGVDNVNNTRAKYQTSSSTVEVAPPPAVLPTNATTTTTTITTTLTQEVIQAAQDQCAVDACYDDEWLEQEQEQQQQQLQQQVKQVTELPPHEHQTEHLPSSLDDSHHSNALSMSSAKGNVDGGANEDDNDGAYNSQELFYSTLQLAAPTDLVESKDDKEGHPSPVMFGGVAMASESMIVASKLSSSSPGVSTGDEEPPQRKHAGHHHPLPSTKGSGSDKHNSVRPDTDNAPGNSNHSYHRQDQKKAADESGSKPQDGSVRRQRLLRSLHENQLHPHDDRAASGGDGSKVKADQLQPLVSHGDTTTPTIASSSNLGKTGTAVTSQTSTATSTPFPTTLGQDTQDSEDDANQGNNNNDHSSSNTNRNESTADRSRISSSLLPTSTVQDTASSHPTGPQADPVDPQAFPSGAVPSFHTSHATAAAAHPTVPSSSTALSAPTEAPPQLHVGSIVTVAPRTWPGMNKLGGVGRITRVHCQESTQTYYNVQYILGGSEQNIDAVFVQPYNETMGRVEHDNRTRDRDSVTSAKASGDNTATATTSAASRPPRKKSFRLERTKPELPPELLAQLAQEGFDVSGCNNSTFTATAVATTNHHLLVLSKKRKRLVTRASEFVRKKMRLSQSNAGADSADDDNTDERKLPVSSLGKAADESVDDNSHACNATPARSETVPADDCQLANARYTHRVTEAFEKGVVHVLSSSLSDDEKKDLDRLCRMSKQGPVKVKRHETFHPKQLTMCLVPVDVHAIGTKNLRAASRTVKSMQAALAGIPIVSATWIRQCLDKKSVSVPRETMWVRSLPSPSVDASLGVAKVAARLYQDLSYRPMDGISIFIAGSISRQKEADMTLLLKGAGAALVSHPSAVLAQLMKKKHPSATEHHHRLVVVCGTQVKLKPAIEDRLRECASTINGSVWLVHANWVFDCISSGDVQDPSNYEPTASGTQARELWTSLLPDKDCNGTS